MANAEQSPAAPIQPRFAPEGVFYLVRKVSVTTDSGISSAHPGTRVTFVREENGKMIVHDGRMELAVQRDCLTNDLDEAEAFSAPPAAVSSTRPKASTVLPQAVPVQQAIPESSQFAASESVPIPASHKVNMAKIQALQSQIDALGVRIEADTNALTAIDDEATGRQLQRKYLGRASQRGVGIRQSKYEVQQRLAALQRQQSALIMQLNAMSQ